MKPRKKRKIQDIDISEISLVDRAATGKSFYLMKRDGRGLEVDDETGQLFDKLLEGFEGVEKLDDKVLPELKKALGILMKYKTDLPDPVLEAVQILAGVIKGGYGYPPAKDEGGDGQDQDDDQDVQDDEQKAKLKKAERFGSLDLQLLKIPYFRKKLKKAMAAIEADRDLDDDQDQDDEGVDQTEELIRLKELVRRQGLELKKLGRGRSAQGKEGVDDDEALEKAGADFDKDGKPTRDLFPSMDLPTVLRGTRRS